MESSKKTWNDQEKKKMITGGGGIGALILLGGALATTAFASAFFVGVKGRSSGKGRHNRHQNPPPENNKQAEEDGAIFTDRQPAHVFEDPSEGAKKEIELDIVTEAFLGSAGSSILEEEEKIEISGGTPGDVEASDQILCSISPKNSEKDAVSDDGFVYEDFTLLEEKSPLDAQNKMSEDEKTEVELTREDLPNEVAEREKNGDTEIEAMSCKEGSETQTRLEENDVEGVEINQKVEERENMELNMEREEVEGLYSGIYGEIREEKKCVEAIEIVVSESHIEEEETGTLLSECGSRDIEHKNVDGDERESALPTETVVIAEEDEAIEESREDKAKYVEEKLVEEEEKCDKPNDGIIPEKCEEEESMGGSKQSDELRDTIEEREKNIFAHYENKEEKILQMIEELIHEDTKEGDAMKNVDEELIYHENIKAPKDDIINEEADVTAQEEEEEEEESSVESSDSSTESNSGAAWPAESAKVKMVTYELGGKIQEDKTVKEDEDFSTSKKNLINKYVVEMGVVKDNTVNSAKRRMVIGTVSLVSSLSCSWFFGLSFVKLCLVLFLTMLVSEIHGYFIAGLH